jgi:hypothetical protein
MAMCSIQTDPGDCILGFCLTNNDPPPVQVPVEPEAGSLDRMGGKVLPLTLVQCSAL